MSVSFFANHSFNFPKQDWLKSFQQPASTANFPDLSMSRPVSTSLTSIQPDAWKTDYRPHSFANFQPGNFSLNAGSTLNVDAREANRGLVNSVFGFNESTINWSAPSPNVNFLFVSGDDTLGGTIDPGSNPLSSVYFHRSVNRNNFNVLNGNIL